MEPPPVRFYFWQAPRNHWYSQILQPDPALRLCFSETRPPSGSGHLLCLSPEILKSSQLPGWPSYLGTNNATGISNIARSCGMSSPGIDTTVFSFLRNEMLTEVQGLGKRWSWAMNSPVCIATSKPPKSCKLPFLVRIYKDREPKSSQFASTRQISHGWSNSDDRANLQAGCEPPRTKPRCSLTHLGEGTKYQHRIYNN